jgi:type III restriction enzyme
MNSKALVIKNRLSLRKPQADSLEILQKITDVLELSNEADPVAELEKVRALYPTCTDFEREFPSVCFALATGVGKTRLMGAFISYLYNAKGIKNYFVLAPNLTIYNKLIDDLSNPQSPKYVFRGISDFAVFGPRIITGDTYEQQQQEMLGETVRINIFNISKINSEVRGGREPRIKRLSEYLGESYFNYLASLPDLVLLMDESHHYRADAGLRAINELRPILGLELTATPIDNHGNQFKNVVYDYPLARALQDGFVKEPAIATRRNFNPDQYRDDPKELDLIKLEDGVRIHEDTKVALDIYARDNKIKLVRPFVLVVAKDTEHAAEIRQMIESERFFGGRYSGKVIEIHSNQRGEEKEENVQRLLDLEKTDNQTEIVIHVNMLKEGWDVTNLYTIIPLRAANSQILTEQTIGRGLRLPYGVRTGEEKVDKLTIIAHDRFQSIIDAANDPNSIIRKENIVEIDPDALPADQEVVTSASSLDVFLNNQRRDVAQLPTTEEKLKAEISIDAQQLVVDVANSLGSQIKNINDLKSSEIQELTIAKMVERIENSPQQTLFKDQLIEAAKQEYAELIEELVSTTIPIPRILVQQSTIVKSGFHDFDLDVNGLNYQPVSEEIVRRTLRTNESEVLQSNEGGVVRDTPINIIVNELVNYPEVEYDREASLLHTLAGQAVDKLSQGKSPEELQNIVLYHKREIGQYVYVQLQNHFYLEESGYEEAEVYPFTKIESHNFSKYTADSVYHYSETISPTNLIPSKVFSGFKKACHNLYKFDSKSEKDFSAILESDGTVLRWLRPARQQFQMYWKRNSQRYEPDFVVETNNTIYLFEVKAERDVNDDEVREKAEAGKKYCESATKYNIENRGKAWKYVLLPHTSIAPNMSLESLVTKYLQ